MKTVRTRWGKVAVHRFDKQSLRKHPEYVATAAVYVPSETKDGVKYEVLRYRNAALKWGCECRDFRFRLRRCKHIARAVGAYRSTKNGR